MAITKSIYNRFNVIVCFYDSISISVSILPNTILIWWVTLTVEVDLVDTLMNSNEMD